ncbi:hypothetical protein PUNSTDRAFT_106424 [Punctularia strigosozonata HHB-11173 SS5]|uniref:uncharacterized protein n=1 Tax=Punctularia strigosozonata (strain HHB-11173) TaxID=741275 RepID=UPI0004418441|nr:uncharacterized protein PUNSTDRAFT_106424 [Punctularia strigosozonata HHB-11173 SS5]EIN06204.1 hypothetical protein PUNSTDRAFT_106424 [Punctularia strigosozonata HHB-11173 SS5]
MWIRKLHRTLTALFFPLLPWLPIAYVGIRGLKSLVPAGSSHSASNELLFQLAPADSPLRSYTVPLTAGVVPKRFHSHNDYVQSVPLLKALSYGAASIEADIWLVDDELYIAHDYSDITPGKTLNSLYLDPLVAILEAANAPDKHTGSAWRGVFETAPSLSLHLLIDIKTDGPSTFNKLYEVLEPLRAAGYLSTWTTPSSSLTPGPITVIGTGNTPLASVQSLGQTKERPRTIFLDAVLDLIPDDSLGVLDKTVCPLASSDFQKSVGASWTVPLIGRRKIKTLVDAAHERGIQARFWHTPTLKVAGRNTVWQMLLDEGVDWLNVDDLPAAQRF